MNDSLRGPSSYRDVNLGNREAQAIRDGFVPRFPERMPPQ
jgi:hypothetical protein